MFFISVIATGSLAQQLTDKTKIAVSSGYNIRDLSWSIAGNAKGQNPNIYSELIWRKLQSVDAGIDIDVPLVRQIRFISQFSIGKIISGSVTDSDYGNDNRQSRIFFADLQSDKGSLFCVNPGIGYRLNVSNNFALTPQLGFGINRQKLHLLDNSGLNSTYLTRWLGPFGSLITNVKINRQLFSQFDVVYHQVNYRAVANWNLVQSFQHPESFKHTAKGFGLEANLAVGYHLNEVLALKLSGGYSRWKTGAGVDELYLADGSSRKTRLNGVMSDVYKINAGIVYTFR